MDFIYIEPINEDHRPKGSFYAIKLSKKDKETLGIRWGIKNLEKQIVLYPQTDKICCKENEVFVIGVGKKKFGKTNKIEVPVFSGDINDWDTYLSLYGKECLFYSLTGEDLHQFSASLSQMQTEFLSIIRLNDIHKYMDYVCKVKRIQQVQRNVICEKFFEKSSSWRLNYYYQNWLFRPSYRIGGFFISTPLLNPIDDDDKCESFYRSYRMDELEQSHPKYAEKKRLREAMNEIGVDNYYTKEYKELSEPYNEISREITLFVNDKLSEEINGENPRFPVSVKDRVKYLYGEEVCELYTDIIDKF